MEKGGAWNTGKIFADKKGANGFPGKKQRGGGTGAYLERKAARDQKKKKKRKKKGRGKKKTPRGQRRGEGETGKKKGGEIPMTDREKALGPGQKKNGPKVRGRGGIGVKGEGALHSLVGGGGGMRNSRVGNAGKGARFFYEGGWKASKGRRKLH